jgi:putative lipoic acid-binding regulatory protein
MSENEPQAPKIEFPCANYPIKIIGEAGDGFVELIVEIMREHCADFEHERVTVRDSRAGRFASVQVYVNALGVDHLQAIHNALRASGRVQMVL